MMMMKLNVIRARSKLCINYYKPILLACFLKKRNGTRGRLTERRKQVDDVRISSSCRYVECITEMRKTKRRSFMYHEWCAN